jgi:hypothetical protein
MAQTAARGGSAEGNMNNPGSVKGNPEKSMERTGPAGAGVSTPGAPAGSSMGNGAMGSGAAPRGK